MKESCTTVHAQAYLLGQLFVLPSFREEVLAPSNKRDIPGVQISWCEVRLFLQAPFMSLEAEFYLLWPAVVLGWWLPSKTHRATFPFVYQMLHFTQEKSSNILTSDGVAPTSDWRSSKEIISSVYLVATPQNFPFYRLQQEKDGGFFCLFWRGNTGDFLMACTTHLNEAGLHYKALYQNQSLKVGLKIAQAYMRKHF